MAWTGGSTMGPALMGDYVTEGYHVLMTEVGCRVYWWPLCCTMLCETKWIGWRLYACLYQRKAKWSIYRWKERNNVWLYDDVMYGDAVKWVWRSGVSMRMTLCSTYCTPSCIVPRSVMIQMTEWWWYWEYKWLKMCLEWVADDSKIGGRE